MNVSVSTTSISPETVHNEQTLTVPSEEEGEFNGAGGTNTRRYVADVIKRSVL